MIRLHFIAVHRSTSADASLSHQLCALWIFVRVMRVATQKTSLSHQLCAFAADVGRRKTIKRWKSERTVPLPRGRKYDHTFFFHRKGGQGNNNLDPLPCDLVLHHENHPLPASFGKTRVKNYLCLIVCLFVCLFCMLAYLHDSLSIFLHVVVCCVFWFLNIKLCMERLRTFNFSISNGNTEEF